ncbi:MAG: hypothetical protein EWM72_00058 [Nitrospira sp.]|nr:MAG: hypothetical protein EWM72_00058 [Nitrospira sp.]
MKWNSPIDGHAEIFWGLKPSLKYSRSAQCFKEFFGLRHSQAQASWLNNTATWQFCQVDWLALLLYAWNHVPGAVVGVEET